MKRIQQILFFAGLAAFAASLFFIGSPIGDTLWRAGVALVLIDLACLTLWPPGDRTLEG